MASPNTEMTAAHDAMARDSTISDGQRATLDGSEELRRPSLTVREEVRLLSPRLLRALRHLMHAPTLSDSDDSLQHDADVEAQRSSVSTVACQICLDVVAVEETVQLSACSHRFCTSCFSQFLTLKINEGQVNLTCFHETGSGTDGTDNTVCGAAIAHSDVQRLVAPPIFSKLEKFQFNKRHDFARQCPFCEHSQLCAGPEQPPCVCESCHRAFCFTHGNAHDARTTCTQYDKLQLRAEKRNRRRIRRISKPCPKCQSPVEKNGGCNHMRCLTCSADFCWLCGQQVSELISDHYDWTNIRGCAGQQMVHIHGLTTTNKFVLYLARTTNYLIVYPIAFALTLLVTVLSCFFVVCTVNRDLSFGQVFRWAFRVISISGYTALEFTAVTIVTGFAAGIFGICWLFHELYKLGKTSVQKCFAWRRLKCPMQSKRRDAPADLDVASPQVLVCEYEEV